MTRCKHRWKRLYKKPTDPDFLKVYNARELDAFKQCETCGAIGKRNEQGTILQLPKSKWENHRAQAARWAENLKTFAAAQGETSQSCNSTY